MIRVTTDLSAMDRLIADLDRKGKAEITRAMADEILAAANEGVPVKTGNLQRSGRVEKGPGTAHRVVYGSPSAGYAAAVHARTTGRGFMFLRNASMRSKPILEAAARAARKAIARAGRR